MINRWLVFRFATLPVSLRLSVHIVLTLPVLGLVALGLIVVNMGIGEYPIAPMDVWRTLTGAGSPEYVFIIKTLRLPRVLVAFLVGAAMAVSGSILQGLSRNPLAAPDVVGVTAGAGLAAVSVITLVPDAPVAALPVAAFGGAVVAGSITYFAAWKNGISPVRLILVGIGVAAVGNALITFLITYSRIAVVSRAVVWMAGSVYGKSWEHLYPLLYWVIVFVPVAFFLARHLDALNLGDEVARGLGSRVEWQRGLLLFTSVALAAAPVAVAGPVGFVGLMAPHITRRLTGAAHGGLLPTSALVGGTIVVGADLLGRWMFAPIEVPVGLLTAAIGAPYFLYLLYRSRNL